MSIRKGEILWTCAVVAAAFALFAGCGAVESSGKDKGDTEETTASESEETEEETTATSAGQTPSDFAESGTVDGIDYEIAGSVSTGDSEQRGYYIFMDAEDELPYKVLIAAGEFASGGYDIEITDIAYDGSEMTITVYETAPSPEDAVPDVMSYPCCGVELSVLPESIKVVTTDGYAFDCLYVYLDATEVSEGYFAVIEDGAGEIMYKTYVYELTDGTYSYINVTATTTSWGATTWQEVINGSGKADTRDDVVAAAEAFGSAGFVMYPGDSAAYSLEEFIAAKGG